jgi:hypothetical protein
MPQCQFPVFCCFCVSEKLHRKYSRNWTKQKPNIQKFTEASREPKRRRREARGVASPPGGVAQGLATQPYGEGPWSTSDVAPSPIKTPQREKPKHPITFPKTHRDPSPSSTRDREGPEALPGTLSERGIATGSLLHRHACLRRDVTLDYGSIAVASWLSSRPCAACLDLVSCLT